MPLALPRWFRGRVWFWLTLSLLVFVSAGVAAYRSRHRDPVQQNDAKVQELAQQSLGESAAPMSDWPQWRGPNRDGVALVERLADWPSDGPARIWEKPAGEGPAGVVIAKGRLFTMVREDDRESVVCWNAATGSEIWRYSYLCAYANEYGSGPRSTPTVDGDFLYAVGASGMMHCLKAFGNQAEIVWTKDLALTFGAAVPKWGCSFSPLVEGDRVFIQPGGPAGNALAALDKRTGEIVWKKHDDEPSYSSPIAATFHGERQILFFTASRLISVEPGSGEKLWDYAWPSDQQCNIATPIVVQDYVFISSAHGRGCAVLHVEKHDGQWQPVLVYNHRRMRNHFSTCVRNRDHLYGFDQDMLACMNFRTGEICWKERGFGKGSLILAGAHLLVLGENGKAALLEASPDGYREKASFTFSTSGRCWSLPAIADGRLYLRDQAKIVCFDLKARR